MKDWHMNQRLAKIQASAPKRIRLLGVSQHNLKSIDLDLPLGKFTAICGPSGSGKSTLTFDTIHAESERRYIETFSPYVRQFLERRPRPKARFIGGLPASIGITGGNPVRNARSTVATLSEITFCVRHLFFRMSEPVCPRCNCVVRDQGVKEVLGLLKQKWGLNEGFLVVAAPVKEDHGREISALIAQGFTRGIWKRQMIRLEDLLEGSTFRRSSELFVVIDRIKTRGINEERVRDALELGFLQGRGSISCFLAKALDRTLEGPFRFTRGRRCPRCGKEFPRPSLALFSFNSPVGACPSCQGFGRITGIDWNLVVPDRSKSILDGALVPIERWEYEKGLLLQWLEEMGIDPKTPWKRLPPDIRDAVLHGGGPWPGMESLFQELENYRYKAHVRIFLARFRSYTKCPECMGTRFRAEALWHRLNGLSIADFYAMSIKRAIKWLEANTSLFSGDPANKDLHAELLARLTTLEQAGLGYLTMDRQSRTLSGGEIARVAISKSLGNALKETLYCLDEPTRGLHPLDAEKMVLLLRRLVARGNTVLAVTHEPMLIFGADEVVKLGPGSGEEGGRIVYQGPPEAKGLEDYARTLYLEKKGEEKKIKAWITVKGARCNNLKGIDVRFPIGAVTAITGVSGSGKSSLVEEVLYRGVLLHLGVPKGPPGAADSITGLEHVKEAVLLDQSPLTRTPRATVATYSRVFSPIRDLFSRTPEAKALGLTPGNFSFNSPLGRCEYCKGLGVEVLEMQFLPDVFLVCPVCKGSRLRPEIRSVRFRNRSFEEVLRMTVKQALSFFMDEKGIRLPLERILELGLGHLRLDQRLNTLSGGEAQRLKLARVFSVRRPGTLYVLDEPLRGLHPMEVDSVLKAIKALVSMGGTVVAVEHSLRFMASSDWVVELGPEGGEKGGYLVYEGRPHGLLKKKVSKTATFFTKGLKPARRPGMAEDTSSSPGRSIYGQGAISIRGARHHNLKAIDVDVPRGRFVVITGPSGSGKSTLAFDIIHSEGERRYIECLPSYMRQFIRLYERPDVDTVSGLSPSVAIEQRRAKGGPMSTVATLTEVAHYLRLLYARASQGRCPGCGMLLKETDRVSIGNEIRERFRACPIYLISPRVRKRKGFFKNALEQARPAGASLVMVDEELHPVTDLPVLDRYREHSISWLFGPIKTQGPLFDSILEKALYYGGGEVGVRRLGSTSEEFFSEKRSCGRCGIGLPDPDPLLFSFNTRQGRCHACNGTGKDPAKGGPCSVCGGSRLSREALSWVIGQRTIGEILGLEIQEARRLLEGWIKEPPWPGRIHQVAAPIVEEVVTRLGFLEEVGLGYLTLTRGGDTLSGGEAQRIRLAAQVGSGLTGLTVVLDEPTIGLHPLDNQRLIKIFKRLRDAGNTVIVVEHDEETIRHADWVIDLGPGGGKDGGRVVAEGTPQAIELVPESVTGACLKSRRRNRVPTKRAPLEIKGALKIEGIDVHNIRAQDVSIPLGCITGIVGVSGSGKSTLLEEVIYKNLSQSISNRSFSPVNCRKILVKGTIKRVAVVDASPIGKTPRSCVVTYLGLFTEIRTLFSLARLSRTRGYTASTFSFNVKGGRCPTCKGQGVQEVRFGFLPPVYITCPVCDKRRYKDEILQVRWSGKNISEVLSMTVDEAKEFFKAHPRLKRFLELLSGLGLGYLKLGQRSPTLSGGEAQRLKLARELIGRGTEGTVYFLDEPTTGLHMKDVERLMEYLERLCQRGNTVIIVEHNPDVIRRCDHIVELGPGGGRHGGRVIFNGPLAEFMAEEARTPTQKVVTNHRAQ